MLKAMQNPSWPLAPDSDAFRAYREHARRELARVKRNLNGLSADDVASLTRKPAEQVRVMDEAVTANLAFLDALGAVMQQSLQDASPAEVAACKAHKARVCSTPKLVQNLLHSFVREWTLEGAEERRECFDLLLGGLDGHLRTQREAGPAPRVLCPDSALARLPYEAQRLGYAAEGCEARAMQFLAGEFVRTSCAQREAHRPQPYVLNTCNRFKAEDHVRVTAVPDVNVASLPTVRFGDFAQLYDDPATRGAFDAVLTAYALDASPNVLRFVRTVAHVVRPGGLWANFGPLAYEAEHDEMHVHGVELSWEELRYAISHFFEVKEERFVDSLNGANALSMMQLQYSCVFFTAVRNDAPSTGIGESS